MGKLNNNDVWKTMTKLQKDVDSLCCGRYCDDCPIQSACAPLASAIEEYFKKWDKTHVKPDSWIYGG